MTFGYSDEFLRPRGHAVAGPPSLLSLPFFTNFAGGDENPISEAGVWRRAANSWHNNKRVSGVVRPTQLSDGSDDCYCLLDPAQFSGGIPNNVEVIATLDLGTGTTQEHEILLRASDLSSAASPPDGQAKCYEFLYNAQTGSFDIVEWLGPFNLGAGTSFVSIGSNDATPGAGSTGNQIRATAVGSALTFYWRANSGDAWLQISHATNADYSSGTCGIGFFATTGGGGQITALGFTDYTVNAL